MTPVPVVVTQRKQLMRWQEAIIDSSKGVGSKSQVREATFFGEGDDMNSQNVVRQRSVSWVTEVRASSALKCDKMCTVLRCAIVELSPLEKRDCIALMPALAYRNLRIAETRTVMMMRPTIRVITRINGYDYRRPERKPRRALGQVFVSSPCAHIVTYAEVLLLSSLSTRQPPLNQDLAQSRGKVPFVAFRVLSLKHHWIPG